MYIKVSACGEREREREREREMVIIPHGKINYVLSILKNVNFVWALMKAQFCAKNEIHIFKGWIQVIF